MACFPPTSQLRFCGSPVGEIAAIPRFRLGQSQCRRWIRFTAATVRNHPRGSSDLFFAVARDTASRHGCRRAPRLRRGTRSWAHSCRSDVYVEASETQTGTARAARLLEAAVRARSTPRGPQPSALCQRSSNNPPPVVTENSPPLLPEEGVARARHCCRVRRRRTATLAPRSHHSGRDGWSEHEELTGKYQVHVRPENGPGAIARTTRRGRGAVFPDSAGRGPLPEVEIRDLAIYETLAAAAVSV
jgi:hypothetical protein